MQKSKNNLLTDQLEPGKISSTVALRQIHAMKTHRWSQDASAVQCQQNCTSQAVENGAIDENHICRKLVQC